MKYCAVCNSIIPLTIKVDEKIHNLCSRTHCLECVPFKGKRRSNKHAQELVCKRCDKTYLYIRGHGLTKTYCGSCGVKRRQRKLKLKMVLYKGGKCELCGYNKCLKALHFHHTDPSTKISTLSHYISNNRQWKIIQEELDKCQLLCANCHSEVEDAKYIGFDD